jgi:malonate transporter
VIPAAREEKGQPLETVVNVAAPVFGLGLLGYLATRVGWFSDESAGGLARFVFDFAVPLMLVRVFARAELPEAFPWPLLVGFYGPAVALYGLGMVVSGRLFGRDFTERTMGGFASSFGNSVLLGLPLALLTFDEAGMVPFLLLLSVHGLGYLTLTTTLVEYARRQDRPLSRLPLSVGRGLVTNPIILGLAGGLLLNLTGLSLPGPLDRTAEYMQEAVTPCALFSLGASLTRCRIAGGVLEPLLLVATKNVLMPLIVWLAAVHVLDLPSPWSRAAILLAALPTGVNVYLFAVRYAAARELATTTVFLSTTFSLVSLPVVLYLLQTMS